MVPARIQWAIDLIGSIAHGRIIEVGCGGGVALDLLAAKAPRATIVGIDRSATQVARARARLATIPAARRPAVECLTLEEAGERWSGVPFDLALAINVNAFWTESDRACPALRAMLDRRGTGVLVYETTPGANGARFRDKVVARIGASGALRVTGVELATAGRPLVAVRVAR